jgi:3',5'-cyclic AMP phosphodiesterase CpdA
MKLIVVADPHIGIEPNKSQRVDTSDHLKQTVEHINAHHADAAYCLFIGDLTNEGELEAYKRFKKLIEPLGVPPLLMIGNHDTRENFQTIFPHAYRDENSFVQFILDLGSDYRLIALDSLNAPPYIRPDRHVGFLCPERLAFLKDSLKTAGERNVIIAMHHHPFRVGLPSVDVLRLENENTFMELIEHFPNVKMLLMAHIHRTISGVVHGLAFSCFKSLDAQGPLDFDAIDPRSGIAEPPSYGVLLLGEGSILIHHEDFTAGVKPESDWEEVLQNNPQLADRFNRLVARMLPEKAVVL